MLDIPLSEWPDGAEWAAVNWWGDLGFWKNEPRLDCYSWGGFEWIKMQAQYKPANWSHWRNSLTPRPKGDSDPVNHPDHYTDGGVECIDAIISALGPQGAYMFCRGNVIKYAWRSGKKGQAAEDMRKTEWYSRKAAELAGDEKQEGE